MNQYSRWKSWAIPLFVVYSGVLLYFIFKTNPLLLSQDTLSSYLTGESQASLLPLPDLSPELKVKEGASSELQVTLPKRYDVRRSGTADESLRIPRRHVLAFSRPFVADIEIDAEPKWSYDSEQFYIIAGQRDLYSTDEEGVTLWQFRLDGEMAEFPHPPVVGDKWLYVGTAHGKLYSLDKKSGTLRWVLPVKKPITQRPLVIQDKLFILTATDDSPELTRIDPATGEVVETKTLGTTFTASPTVNEKLGLIYVVATTGELVAIDVNSGKTKWTHQPGHFVVVEEPENPEAKVTSAPATPAEPKQVFVSDDSAKIVTSITLAQQQLFFGQSNEKAVALDAKTGKVSWHSDLTTTASGAFTYVPRFDHVATILEDGYLVVLDRKTGEGQWRFQTSNKSLIKDVAAVRLDNSAIMKLELKWHRQGWSLWAPCASRSICILNPEKGQLLGRVSVRGTLASLPYFFDKHFFVTVKEDESSPEGPWRLAKLAPKDEIDSQQRTKSAKADSDN